MHIYITWARARARAGSPPPPAAGMCWRPDRAQHLIGPIWVYSYHMISDYISYYIIWARAGSGGGGWGLPARARARPGLGPGPGPCNVYMNVYMYGYI